MPSIRLGADAMRGEGAFDNICVTRQPKESKMTICIFKHEGCKLKSQLMGCFARRQNHVLLEINQPHCICSGKLGPNNEAKLICICLKSYAKGQHY